MCFGWIWWSWHNRSGYCRGFHMSTECWIEGEPSHFGVQQGSAVSSIPEVKRFVRAFHVNPTFHALLLLFINDLLSAILPSINAFSFDVNIAQCTSYITWCKTNPVLRDAFSESAEVGKMSLIVQMKSTCNVVSFKKRIIPEFPYLSIILFQHTSYRFHTLSFLNSWSTQIFNLCLR